MCAVFVWFCNTPIVKSSGCEQMILLLIGITLSFFITIVFLIKPSPAVCSLQRIGLWFCFSLILCALFVKLVRIARIFLWGKISPVRPECIAPEHQILFTFLLVGIQMLLVAISLSVVPPSVSKTLQKNETNQDDFPVFVIQCTSPHIVLVVLQMVYFTALTIASNTLAILTIQFPQNVFRYIRIDSNVDTCLHTILHCYSWNNHPNSCYLTHHSVECSGCSIMSVWSKSVHNDSLAEMNYSDVLWKVQAYIMLNEVKIYQWNWTEVNAHAEHAKKTHITNGRLYTISS